MLSKLRSLVVVGTTTIAVLLVACGGSDTKTVQAGPATCDSSKCATGNTCLPLDGVTSCRKTCSSNDNPATSCPFGYNCTDTQPGSGVPAFCVASTAVGPNGSALTQAAKGQWGSPCNAAGGAESNPDCDSAQGFLCYGISPSDGNAYCTLYGCTKDSDCGPGFGCSQINATPNVKTAKRSTADQEQNVCLKRAYCSSCMSDVDCPTTAQGAAQHCITDTLNHGFCTPECSDTSNCNNEAKCATVVLPDNSQKKVCYPRSTVCVGNGDLCSSCRVDTDCGEDGICIKGEYTTEHFCAKKAANGDCSQCPKTITTPARTIGCSTSDSDLLPAGYCTGIYSLSGQAGSDLGCWTPDR